MTTSYCLIWDSRTLKTRLLYLYISPRNRVAQLYPRGLSKSKLSYPRRSFGQSVLVSGHLQGPWPVFLSPWNFLYKVAGLLFLAPSLTRGWVCNLLLLLVLTSAVLLGSESRGTKNYTVLSTFLRLFQPEGQGPRIYIPQEQGGPVIPPGTGFPFRRLLRIAALRWRYSNPSPHGARQLMLKLKLIYYRQSVGQSVLVLGLGSLFLVISVGADRTESNTSRSFSIAVCVSCVAMAAVPCIFTNLLPSNGCSLDFCFTIAAHTRVCISKHYWITVAYAFDY
jgi:hypothetical protein